MLLIKTYLEIILDIYLSKKNQLNISIIWLTYVINIPNGLYAVLFVNKILKKNPFFIWKTDCNWTYYMHNSKLIFELLCDE